MDPEVQELSDALAAHLEDSVAVAEPLANGKLSPAEARAALSALAAQLATIAGGKGTSAPEEPDAPVASRSPRRQAAAAVGVEQAKRFAARGWPADYSSAVAKRREAARRQS